VKDPLSPPAPLADHHQLDDFSSGEGSLDDWLKRRARANQASGASRTFVVCEGEKVVGYYAVASGAVTVESVPGRFRRNMPDPVPVAILARLAVHEAYQGRGLGRALFRDSARRVAQAADAIGICGIVVHAISENARKFYLALGFDPCPSEPPSEPMTLVATLSDIRAALSE
jgi:GNAT superfamily N-acetyltransferase